MEVPEMFTSDPVLLKPTCIGHCNSWHILESDMSNSIESAIAIAFFGTIAIGIAIAKAIFQLLLLILLREFSNYCYCYWYC